MAWPTGLPLLTLPLPSTERTGGTLALLIGRGEDKRPVKEATRQGRDAVIEHSLDSEERAQACRRATPEATLRRERRGQFAARGPRHEWQQY